MLVAAGWPTEAQAAASAPSKWAGRWDDPEAPGCKREIVMNFDGTKGRLIGAESIGMNPGPQLWSAVRACFCMLQFNLGPLLSECPVISKRLGSG